MSGMHLALRQAADTGLDDLGTVAWLHRRAGFGLHPDDLELAAAGGVGAAYDDLVGAATDGRPDPQPDPWEGLDLDPRNGGRAEAIRSWVARFLTTTTPYVDRRTWMLHGWLVSGVDKVPPEPMVDQIRLLHGSGGGSYPDLLRLITIDRAMLVYLDGRTSTAESPNENYGRELMELFALGVGDAPDGSEQPYTEDDVIAAARALTGWAFRAGDAEARLFARRHDDTPQTLLGVDGVDDVDSVIAAVTSHPEHPRFVARRIVAEYVGDPTDAVLDGLVDELAAVYADGDMQLDPTIASALQIALDGRSTPIVSAPIPWMIASARTLGLDARQVLRATRGSIRDMGQTPMLPPGVAGWPGGTAWLTTSSLIARTNLADRLVGEVADSEPLAVAADDGDLDRVAALLGQREPFGPTTTAAIRGAATPRAGLTLALVSPEGLLS
jgi:uncharacterized protein (DUF1800 family)